MKHTTFKGFHVKQIDFISNVRSGTRLELTFNYAYRVRYATNNTCEGELTATVQAKDDPKNFHINMVVCGVFAFQDDVSKEELHLETYDELFPHFRSLMMTITAAGGIPPVTPPYIDISGSDIYRFDSGEKK